MVDSVLAAPASPDSLLSGSMPTATPDSSGPEATQPGVEPLTDSTGNTVVP
jgi:hypothetical protein